MREDEERVTYATLAAGQTEAFQRKFEAALNRVKSGLGADHGHVIEGDEVGGSGHADDRSPIDTRMVLGRFPSGTPAEVKRAVAAARRGFPAWSRRPWQERTDILRGAAQLIEERGFELSALVGLEVGKNRLEAMGDVTETADLIRYYCDQMARHDGFVQPMARFFEYEETWSVMRPYGVWAVISPFNFPAALLGGPAGGALVAGNTVVLKPSFEAPLTGKALCRILLEAGVPGDALQLLHGPAATGEALALEGDVDGLLFTGSKAVGLALLRRFGADWPRPCITEMGGKNPAIVMGSADLDAAAEGVMRSAFGLQGQKCSACSRAYVQASVKERFLELLVEKTRALTVGDPTRHGVFLGPVIHERSYRNFQDRTAQAARDGRVVLGGELLRDGDLAHGFFVAPTVVDGLPQDHSLFQEELFLRPS
jgi:1-pyrroline-5-carboxylate dehydrogenase